MKFTEGYYSLRSYKFNKIYRLEIDSLNPEIVLHGNLVEKYQPLGYFYLDGVFDRRYNYVGLFTIQASNNCYLEYDPMVSTHLYPQGGEQSMLKYHGFEIVEVENQKNDRLYGKICLRDGFKAYGFPELAVLAAYDDDPNAIIELIPIDYNEIGASIAREGSTLTFEIGQGTLKNLFWATNWSILISGIIMAGFVAFLHPDP